MGGLELCPACFRLQHIESKMYVAVDPPETSSARSIALTERGSHFWRVRAGTYSWPGEPTENTLRWDNPDACYMLHGSSGETSVAPCPPRDESVVTSWPEEQPRLCENAGCESWIWFSTAPEAGQSHVISLHTNSTSLLGGDVLKVACEVCPSNSPANINASGTLLIAALLLAMVAPVIIMCVRHRWHLATIKDKPGEQWPPRRRPLIVLIVIQVSWMIAGKSHCVVGGGQVGHTEYLK